MCLWESGQPEGKGLRKEYGITCSELIMNAVLEVFSGRAWIPAGCTVPRLSTVFQLECLGCDWNTGALAMPVLKRAVSRNGFIPLLFAGVLKGGSELAGEGKLPSQPSLNC